MLTIEKLAAYVLQDRTAAVMLGRAMANDLVMPNPYYRQIMAFVVEFYEKYRRVPKKGDLSVWINNELPAASQDAVQEALAKLLREDTSDLTPEYLHSLLARPSPSEGS